RERLSAVTAPPPAPVPTPGQKALTTFRLPPAATAGLPALPEPVLPPSEQGVTAQLNSQFRREQAEKDAADQARRDRERTAAERQRELAGIRVRQTTTLVDTIGVQAEQRRLGAQQQLNEYTSTQIALQDQ